jgi:YD repeat-containing protein
MHTSADASPRRFTYDEYIRMGEVGILPERGVELISGEILVKNGRGTPYRFTYDDYVRLSEEGILAEGERTELVNGEIVCMTPVGHRHIYVVDLLTEYLGEWARGRAVLRVQSPLPFNDIETRHPDLTLFRPHPDRYRSRQAGPWDVLVAVEVADSSLSRDLEKAVQYARAAIPEYWIADVNREVVMVHLNPVGGEYTDVREYAHGESFVSPGMAGREVRVEDVLGPAARG